MPTIPRFDDPLLNEINKHIQLRMERIKLELASGGAADFASYQHKVGQYHGLQQALFTIEDAIKHFGIDEET